MKSVDEFLQLLHGVKKTTRGFMAYCPGHDDGAKCGRNGKEGQSLEVWEDKGWIAVKCYASCTREAILKSINLSAADLKIGNNGIGHKPRKEERKEVAWYDYKDLNGDLVFQVVRFEPKTFRQRRPDGAGGWIWDLKGIEPVLYHRQEIKTELLSASTIYIVEGEKDADAARMMGLAATTSPMGAGKWRKSYTQSLFGAAAVVIIADKDEPGRKHAADIAVSLHTAGGQNIKVIEMPGTGKDFSDWLGGGGKLPELEAAVAAAPLYTPAPPTSEDAEASRAERLKEISGEVYTIENGRICYKKTQDYQEIAVPLCNFTAHVTEEITRDDGLEASRFFKVQGRSCTGAHLSEIEVPAANFAGLNWVVGEWGMRAIIGAGMNAKDKLREAIQLMSNDAAARHIFTHTGWRHHDGKDIYLSQGGAIGAENVDVDLESQLKRYFLPAPDPARTVEAVKASLEFIYIVSDPHVTIPLWAAMYLAPLADAIDLAFTLWLVGPSGCFKSTLTGLVLNHFGDFDQNHLPASWQDTSNLLQKLLFLAKDAPLVIDDWAPGQDHGKARELEAKAEHVIRSQGNRQGRGRMNKDTSTRGNYVPRGMLITSGEQTPSGHSHTARIFTIPLEKNQVNIEMLTDAQRNRAQYRYAMAAYIAWLQPNWGDRKLELKRRFEELRGQVLDAAEDKKIHARLPDVIAMMQLGLTMGAQFALETGAIDQTTHDGICSDGLKCFIDLATAQGERVEDERPAKRFCEALQSSINMGTAILRNKADMMLTDPGPGKVAVGWRDYSNGHVLLEPLAAHQMVVQFCQKSGRAYTITPAETWKDLCREKMADLGPDGRPTAMARITALPKPTRVVRLRAEYLGFEAKEVPEE